MSLNRLIKETSQMRAKHQERVEKTCTDKNRYTTLKYAEEIGDKVWAERGISLRPYQCELCSGWHLTSKSKHH